MLIPNSLCDQDKKSEQLSQLSHNLDMPGAIPDFLGHPQIKRNIFCFM